MTSPSKFSSKSSPLSIHLCMVFSIGRQCTIALTTGPYNQLYEEINSYNLGNIGLQISIVLNPTFLPGHCHASALTLTLISFVFNNSLQIIKYYFKSKRKIAKLTIFPAPTTKSFFMVLKKDL